MDDQKQILTKRAALPGQSDIDETSAEMNAKNTAKPITLVQPILVKPAVMSGDVKKPMSLTEARNKLFSSVVSNALNKSHDHVKTVAINAAAANKERHIPTAPPPYVTDKNELICLQIVKRKNQQPQVPLTTATSTATSLTTTNTSSSAQSNRKEKSVPLLLPFSPGQLTIKSNRTSELMTISNIKSNEATAQRLKIVKPNVGIVSTDFLPKRARTLTNIDSKSSSSIDSGGDDSKVKVVPKKTFLDLNAAHVAVSSTQNRKQLEQHFNKIQSTLGVGHMPKEVSSALNEFKQWQLENDADNKLSKQILNNKLNEFIGKNVGAKRCRVNNNPTQLPLSATSTDSENDTAASQSQKRKTSLTSSVGTSLNDAENARIKKIKLSSRSSSCDSTTSTKTLPEEAGNGNVKVEEVMTAKRKDTDHDSLYHLLRSEATEHLMKRKAALSGTQSSSSSSSSLSSAASVQILNGRLSDPKGPIRLLEKSVLAPLPEPQQMLLAHVIPNAVVPTIKTDSSFLDAGLTAKSKAKHMRNSINFQENLEKIFALKNKLPPNSKLSSRALERLKNSPRRTASGRSKSFSSSGIIGPTNTKMRFKIAGMTGGKSRRMRMSSKNMNRQWNKLTETLTATLQECNNKSKASQATPPPPPPPPPLALSAPSTSPSATSEPSATTDDRAINADTRNKSKDSLKLTMTGNDCVTDLMRSISWNELNGQGNVMHMGVKFKRNEFGMIEVNDERAREIERTDEPKNYGKRTKLPKPEVKDGGCMLASGSGMTCGHTNFDECFDAVIARIQNGAIEASVINQRKPHEYYSNEIKEFIMSMVRKNDHQCNLIKAKEIVDAIGNAPSGSFHFDMDKDASMSFTWQQCVVDYNAMVDETKHLQLAPNSLFINPFPSGGNPFSIGEKLEAIDPHNCALFCICTVVGMCGYRIKLHFDGYHSSYDFWTNADSVDLFHVGWCNRTGRKLQWPHRRIGNSREIGTFDWSEYLLTAKAKEAPRSCFTHLNSAVTNKNPFKIGMKLEADDIKFTRKICVATIGDVIDSRILITFDGFDEASNYWTDITSPYIHPVNWHDENGYSITSPPGWKDGPFDWETYLRINRSEGVPDHSFCTRNPIAFSVGMALEIVDKKNPSLIRPASIVMVDEYEIKILFIGWPEEYAYWVDDDSPDIHPPNWSRKTGHPIENVPGDSKAELHGCGIRGCRGIGNSKKPELSKHSQLSECPYEMKNWLSDDRRERPNRIERKNRTTNSGFNTGASACRTRLPAAAVADMHTHVSLKPLLNPAELAGMLPKDVEMFRRLQVSSKFLLDNSKLLGRLHDKWQARLQCQAMVRLSAADKNPLNWTIDEVSEFVSQLPNCSMLGPVFVEHGIDGMAFLSLRKMDMMNIMGLSTGSTIKVFNRIIYLREECNAHYIDYN